MNLSKGFLYTPIILIFINILVCNACSIFFLSTGVVKGDIGIEGANAVCRQEAYYSMDDEIQAISDSFIAYLSNSTHDALYRVRGSGGDSSACFITSSSPRQEVAITMEEFRSGSLQTSPAAYDVNGTDVYGSNPNYWTGTTYAGTASTFTCNDWTTASPNYLGIDGTFSAGMRWTQNSRSNCDLSHRLLCVSVSPATNTTMTPPPYFVDEISEPCSSQVFITASRYGTDHLYDPVQAEDVCRKEAANSPYAAIARRFRDYKAFYYRSDRFPDAVAEESCIVSSSGRQSWTHDATNQWAFVQLPDTRSDGELMRDGDAVWFGGNTNLVGVIDTCNAWESDSHQDTGDILYSNGTLGAGKCDRSYYMLCLHTFEVASGPTVEDLLSESKIMFVDTQPRNGNIFKGLEGADEVCQTAALASAVPRVRESRFIAYLSDSENDAYQRLVDAGTDLNAPNGALLFDAVSNLSNPRLWPQASLLRDSNGMAFTHPSFNAKKIRLMSGTARGGRRTGLDCGNWSISATEFHYVGGAGIGEDWLVEERAHCGYGMHLICIEVEDVGEEVDFYSVPHTMPMPGSCYYMFTGAQRSTVGELQGFDSWCHDQAFQSDNNAIKTNSQRFMAIVSTDSSPFSSRFVNRLEGNPETTCWQNTRGLLVAADAYHLLGGPGGYSGTFLFDQNGGGIPPVIRILTGTAESLATGNNCDNFTSTTSYALSTAGFGLSDGTNTPCSTAKLFACIQFRPGLVPTGAPSTTTTTQAIGSTPEFTVGQSGTTSITQSMDMHTSTTVDGVAVSAVSTTAQQAAGIDAVILGAAAGSCMVLLVFSIIVCMYFFMKRRLRHGSGSGGARTPSPAFSTMSSMSTSRSGGHSTARLHRGATETVDGSRSPRLVASPRSPTSHRSRHASRRSSRKLLAVAPVYDTVHLSPTRRPVGGVTSQYGVVSDILVQDLDEPAYGKVPPQQTVPMSRHYDLLAPTANQYESADMPFGAASQYDSVEMRIQK